MDEKYKVSDVKNLFSPSTEELADALLADEMRKASVTSTQAQVHSPMSLSGAAVQQSHPAGPVTSTAHSVASGMSSASGDSGIDVGSGVASGESSGESVEKIQHQLAITTQELMETKEALDKSAKMVLEMKEREETQGKVPDSAIKLC